MSEKTKIPATGPGNGDPIDKLLKIDAPSSLPGYSDGIQASYAYTPEQWRRNALSVARQLADAGEPFTVRDIKAQGIPEPDRPNQWGSLIAAMRHQKIAEQIGWTGAVMKSGDISAVRVWQGTRHG